MDLKTFRSIVDDYPDEITPLKSDLVALYTHLGLAAGGHFSRQDASKHFYRKISEAFASGHQAAWRRCRALREELIQREIIDGEKVDPYFSILDHMLDALRSQPQTPGDIQGDWAAAIRHAYDNVRLNDWSPKETRQRSHARAYEVAKAAKQLQIGGIRLIRQDEKIYIEPNSEATLVGTLERLIKTMGGVNVCRRIFEHISRLYDPIQERYHVVSHQSSTGGGSPQIPFGYLLLLAAKHFVGTRPIRNTDQNWSSLRAIATGYAAVLDVQEYAPIIWRSMDAIALLPYLRESALYDTLFRIPQIRGSDVVKIARGILRDFDFDRSYGAGYSLNELLAVVRILMDSTHDRRGPVSFDPGKIAQACPQIEPDKIRIILDEVLTHPSNGPNRFFTKPTDAPPDNTPEGRKLGHNFFQRPLLSADRKAYWLLDHSLCALPCLESILAVLRAQDKEFDAKLGLPIEAFLRDQLAAHHVPSLTGKYVADSEEGECDIAIETSEAIVFMEVKKKPLTRRAQAGSDAYVLLDLANSLLAAQVQLGWHEVRLRKHGFLELDDRGVKTRLELRGRAIERVAVSLMQFGSFQDRIMLKQFLEGTLRADFSVNEPSLQKQFTKFNELLHEVRTQINLLHPDAPALNQPFFHCWFLSIPQLLVLLDDVDGPESLKRALWKTRHLATGSGDFYHDYAWMRRASKANESKQQS